MTMADVMHLFWVFFWLGLLNLFLFTLWAILAMGSQCSREEERREAVQREGESNE